jgi:hypothetical protein
LRANFVYTDCINGKLLFNAVTEGGDDTIVVKFTRRYSETVHHFLARQGHAPALRAVNHIPGGWKMVVMDRSKYIQLGDFNLTLKLRDETRLAIRRELGRS